MICIGKTKCTSEKGLLSRAAAAKQAVYLKVYFIEQTTFLGGLVSILSSLSYQLGRPYGNTHAIIQNDPYGSNDTVLPIELRSISTRDNDKLSQVST